MWMWKNSAVGNKCQQNRTQERRNITLKILVCEVQSWVTTACLCDNGVAVPSRFSCGPGSWLPLGTSPSPSSFCYQERIFHRSAAMSPSQDCLPSTLRNSKHQQGIAFFKTKRLAVTPLYSIHAISPSKIRNAHLQVSL